MADKKTRLWKRIVGYLAFTLLALLLTFFLTFPYEALKERVRLEADALGYVVRIDRMGPGAFAVRASDVQVSKKSDSDPPPEALRIDSLSVRPSLFPPGLVIRLGLLGGSVVARASALGAPRIRVDVEDVDLSKGNLKGFSGIDFAGQLEAHLDLSSPSGAGSEPDLSAASGAITFQAKGLAVNGGKVNIVIPQYGPEPGSYDLPKVAFGELSGKLKIEKGTATIEEFKSSSNVLESTLAGTVKLAKRLEYSEANIDLRIKPDPELIKQLGVYALGLSRIGTDAKDPNWRSGRVTGYLGSPKLQ